MKDLSSQIRSFLVPGLIVLVWALVSWLSLLRPVFLPSPVTVFDQLVSDLSSGLLLVDAYNTIIRTFIGFAIAGILGVSAGLTVGSSRLLHRLTQPTIDFFRSIPATALFPLFILIFGTGNISKIGVVIFAVSLVVLVNTVSGVQNADQARRDYAQTVGLTRWQHLRRITIYEALPDIVTGLRIGVSIALILVVVAEMLIGSQEGLGRTIYDAQLAYRTPRMYAAIIITGIIGYILNMIFVRLEARFVHWSGY